ncbi:MAG: triose-phosphate isomerase [Patescibacteria group bacterium]
MKKQKKLIVGNWKMNPESLDDAKKIARDIKRGVVNIKKTDIVLCPPFVYIPALSGTPKSPMFLGSQDCHSEDRGPFTGEVSITQLYEFGVRFVIVGHSERRKMGESEEVINRKIRAVVIGGMTAIVCIGENERDSHGDYYEVIKSQIHSALKDVPKKMLSSLVIAYEPVWAIGAKEAMSPNELHETSIFIKKVLRDSFGIASDGIRIIYGGAVDRVNADRLIKDGGVSGFLVGRESLKPKDFMEIVKLADSI